jgi:hypothetical protein
MTKSIYDLELHEALDIDTKNGRWQSAHALRVPGGWVYNFCWANGSGTAVFVPFDNEFQDSHDPVGF